MAEMHRFQFADDTLGHILQDRRVAVPVYQRSFAWEADEIDDYWNDIKPLVATSDDEYFIGTIVFSQDGAGQPGYSAIIDGQQRLATTAMVYAAIRSELRDRGEQTRGDIIHRKYLTDEDEHSGLEEPRLRLNSEDDPFFSILVVEGTDPSVLPARTESHTRLAEGYEQIRFYVREEVTAAGRQWVERLLGWADFIQKRLRVVTVTVPTEADAFLVFETLNDRGADLTIADLLKNLLFRMAGDSMDMVRDTWMKCLGALEISAENALFTTFIRHAWSSRYGSTRERELYKGIKERVASKAQALETSSHLLEAARHYSAILNSQHDFWLRLGSTARGNVETLARLEIEQSRPLLLALMQHFSDRELKRALRSLVRWGVRGLIVGGIGGGKTEKTYCDAALEVRSGNIKTTDDLLTQLSSIVPTDKEFQAAFAVARVTKPRLARYYLITLESAQRGDLEPELVPNTNEEEVNLEHVLPKARLPKLWPRFSADEHRAFLHRLGNLCLLQKGPNDKGGNESFTVKRPILGASALELTKEIGLEADWTSAEIETRQLRLASLALNAWPRTP